MTIHVLDQTVASLISAGEVVERPAAAVKELVENALDAGATRVGVEVKGGGLALLRVSDNGCGIPAPEVLVAFQRHATSKVSSAEDLVAIRTLGFRGEALPSIAAVAEVSVLTRTRDEDAGTFLQLAFGREVEQGRRGCPPGTTITVRHLFAEVPARAKFLRSPATEVSHISNTLTHYALAYPEVQFTLKIEDRETFRSPGNGDLRDALFAVYGGEVAHSLLSINEDGEVDEGEQLRNIRVKGYVSPPSVTRTGRHTLSFFVNRRWVQNRMLGYAVVEAYQGLMMTGRHPIAVLNIELPPSDVDVNIHPAKIEVRFVNERLVFASVQKAVRQAILVESPIPTITAGSFATPRPNIDQFRQSVFQAGGWAAKTHAPSPVGAESAPPQAEEAPLIANRLPILRVLGQVGATYLIAEGPDGMYLIDQHTAHERVMFERILQSYRERQVESQGLLEPVTVELPLPAAQSLGEHQADLEAFGFALEPFGEQTYLIRAVPAALAGNDVAATFLEVAEALSGGEGPDEHTTRAAMTLACHSAVRAGQILSLDEMRELVRQLESTAAPHTCPHGRPTMIHLSATQLEREFGRR